MGSTFSKFKLSKNSKHQNQQESTDDKGQSNATTSSSSSSSQIKKSRNNNGTTTSNSSSTDIRVQRSESVEHLKLGSLTETWKNQSQWNRFKLYLGPLNEGVDSDNVPMSLDRYALFLELYVTLDRAERVDKKGREDLKHIVRGIRYHSQDFFGRERCLKCIDKVMRSTILSNVKSVLDESSEPGLWVFQPAYPRVLDKLNEFVGSFHDPDSIS